MAYRVRQIRSCFSRAIRTFELRAAGYRCHSRRIDRVKRTIHVALLALTAFAAPAFAQADKWPTKPITYVVPFAAGGTTDVLARLIGQKLSTALGQPVIVDNKPGAGGNIGS